MRAGFVLAGGHSTRMDWDKALLPAGQQTLVEHVAGLVRNAVDNVILIVACDMPSLTAEFLGSLLDLVERLGKDCLAPVTGRGLEPLCSVYHARVAPLAARALQANLFKMQDFVRSLDFAEWPVADPAMLRNVNTPQDL
jgi:molybdopterin-guanine dinucleotide biosynthesis protein A